MLAYTRCSLDVCSKFAELVTQSALFEFRSLKVDGRLSLVLFDLILFNFEHHKCLRQNERYTQSSLCGLFAVRILHLLGAHRFASTQRHPLKGIY